MGAWSLDEQLKYRLTGAAVLVLLAVIFVPMILDGGPRRELERARLEIPPRPDVRQPDGQAEPPHVEVGRPAAAPETPLVQAAPTDNPPADKPAVSAVAKPKPEEPAAKPKVARPKPARPKPAKPTTAKAAKPKPPAPKPAKAPPPKVPAADPATSWVVQVGSFTSRANAVVLRDKLRAGGYASFVESFATAGKTAHRVRIGPSARARAEGDLQSLRQSMKMDGIIVRYP